MNAIGRIRAQARELGFAASPPDSGDRRQVLNIFLTLGIVGELLGPVIDFGWHLVDPAHPAFYQTSWTNLVFAAHFGACRVLLKKLSVNTLVRLLVYGAFVLGIPSLHVLGGALGPAVGFLSIPMILGGFFLPAREWWLMLGFSVGGWFLLLIFELVVLPPPAIAQDPLVFQGTYIAMTMGGLWALSTLFFGAHRRIHADFRHAESQLHVALEQVEQRSRELEKAVKAKDTFLASVSHELRTPLAGIVGLAEIAEHSGGRIDPSHMQKMHAASVHFLRIVENLLDLTRLESGDMTLKPAETDVRALMEQTVDLFQSVRSEETQLKITLGPLPESVFVDGEKVRRILANLLSNAIKATPAGTVEVTAEYSETASELVLQVIDTGSGFDVANMEGADISRVAWVGEGMGLGLQIVNALVAALGGAVELDSRLGEGTRAVVHLPAEPCGSKQLDTSVGTPSSTQRHQILIVDDHPDLLEVFRMYCETAGWQAHVANRPEEGLEMLRRDHYDLVLMDLRMPETDGHMGLQLVEREFGDRRPPVLALTAHVAGDDERKLRRQGFAGFVPKPIAYSAFVDKLRAHLH